MSKQTNQFMDKVDKQTNQFMDKVDKQTNQFILKLLTVHVCDFHL